jgi:hypothetical protein
MPHVGTYTVWAIEPGRPRTYWREVGWAEIHGDTISFTLNASPLQRFEISKDKPQPLNKGERRAGKET